MTNLTLDDNAAKYQIRAFKPGMIQVNDTIYQQSLIITPNELLPNWAVYSIDDLTTDQFSTFIGLKPVILLIGTGEQHHFVPLERYGHLLNHGIGVEIMSTSAACRTYNALSAENRIVVAGLIVAEKPL